MECQSFSYKPNPTTHLVLSQSPSATTKLFIERVASYCFSFEKHLVSGVDLSKSFLRTRSEFRLMFNKAGIDDKVSITQTTLIVLKMTLTQCACSSFETTLAKDTTFLSGKTRRVGFKKTTLAVDQDSRHVKNSAFTFAKTTNLF